MRRIPPETYDREYFLSNTCEGADGKGYHVDEQTVYRLRRGLRTAGFRQPVVRVDANIVRDGSHHTTEGLEGSWMIRMGQRPAALRSVRLLCGNDIWGIATR